MYHEISEFQNMLINIIDCGEKEVWQTIEKEKKPLERCRKRRLFWSVLQQIGEKDEKSYE